MTPADLLTDLIGRGIEVQANGDKLRIGPQDRLTPVDLDQLRQHKAVILGLLRSEGREATALDRWPIIPGTEHWNPYHDPADLAADRWGRGFVPGFHVDIRQPSRLRGLCSPPTEPEEG
jgi:hypothetical protein